MDFTYILATILGAIVTAIMTLTRRFKGFPHSRRWSLMTLGAEWLAFAFLILDLRHALDWGVGFLLLDFTILTICALLGMLAVSPLTAAKLVKP